MSSPNKRFECHWRPSRRLFVGYLLVQGLAWLALSGAQLPVLWQCLGYTCCVLHAAWVLPRQIWLSHASAFRALRHDVAGWQLCNTAGRWQRVQLMPDSLALPVCIVLRVRLAHSRRTQSICVPADAMDKKLHRQLRVRLKFARDRWAVPE